jgi:hypothetical protein
VDRIDNPLALLHGNSRIACEHQAYIARRHVSGGGYVGHLREMA